MDWQAVSAICAVLFTVLQFANAVVALKIKSALADLKLQIAESKAEEVTERVKELDNLKEWAEARFVLKIT